MVSKNKPLYYKNKMVINSGKRERKWVNSVIVIHCIKGKVNTDVTV